VTAFDHRDAGTPESDWSRSELPGLPILELPSPTDHLMVLAAHPDDETLGAGGLIAAAHDCGTAVTVVIASDGDASHPASTTHTRGQLATLRRAEATAAVRTLAPSCTLHFLGLPDGELAQYHDALTAQVEYFGRSVTHLAAPWQGDRHPDHAACARAASVIAARLGVPCWHYPIWLWHWGRPTSSELPWRDARIVRLDAVSKQRKALALRCHVTQHSALSDLPGDEVLLSGEMLAHFERDFETFVVGDPPAAARSSYFDALYERADDPWDLESRFYEQRKRDLLLAALPRPRFRRAFEPGCATGLITERLAERCDDVVAWDVAERALEQSRRRLLPAARVEIAQGAIPAQWPSGEFDLLVLSEVGYYCPDLDALVERVDSCLAPDGVVVACHWRHPAADHPHSAEEVHAALGARLQTVTTHVEDDFLLHVWTRSGRSVAAESGLLA
jgi:LmbE family N-acetylglucosaminyl deacetylase